MSDLVISSIRKYLYLTLHHWIIFFFSVRRFLHICFISKTISFLTEFLLITLEALSEQVSTGLSVLCHRFFYLRNETNMNNIFLYLNFEFYFQIGRYWRPLLSYKSTWLFFWSQSALLPSLARLYTRYRPWLIFILVLQRIFNFLTEPREKSSNSS